ncbi:MAG: PH domain-containing protein [Nocardioidaceae bacterium]
MMSDSATEPPTTSVGEAALAEAPAAGGHEAAVADIAATDLRRLHPVTPLLRSWRLVGFAGAIGFGVFRDELDRLAWVWHALNGDVEVSVLLKGLAALLGVAVISLAGAWWSWRTTGFAIVTDRGGMSTLLYHRGWVVTQRSQVRLNRVQSVDVNQPIVARLCGLATVRLEMAAGEDASVELAYLSASEAWALRREILRHTSGTVAASVESSPTTHLEHASLVAEISTLRLVQANLLEGVAGWVLLVVWVVALVVTPFIWGTTALVAGLSGILPVTLAILSQTRRQVRSIMRDANFRLHRTENGISISSGLTSTVHRTIDYDRIQGVRLVEPFWWRRLGWASVRVDIAGAKKDEDGASLMPVAARSQALTLITDVTGERLDEAPFAPAGAGSRRLDPFGWRWLGVALLDRGAVRRYGRLHRSSAYVPYARVQSVSAEQGWLQRRLDLATVHLDLPRGAQRWTARHRAHADAADLVVTLERLARLHRLAADPADRAPQA